MPKTPGYVVGEVEITDPAGFQDYVGKVGATLAGYDARLIIRGEPRAKEGPIPVGTIVVIEFASVAEAERWYHSPAYSEIIPLRQRAANTRLYIVEGEPQ
jgi:uncharacterized protein (DUF1330 family)